MKQQLISLEKIITSVVCGGLLFTITACDKPNLTQDKGKYSYSIGVQVARNMKQQQIDIDAKAFSAALEDVMTDKQLRLSDQERDQALRKMSEGLQAKSAVVAQENIKKGVEYLEENKKKDGVKVTESGLQYKVITEGAGSKPKSEDTVEVHYRGTLIDGKEFDSSYSRNQPAQFPVKAVISGWTEALQLMKESSKYQLVIPANIAYGERGSPPSIPPNSVLVFEVELLKILKKEAVKR
ncbi:MAG: hypothetical protein A2Z20_07735 [Bdellovibrionales bacterium RBG_16_40_8]|nr:MAG: hypothetical protein A2Z20_07735 [Bdellovibrionales bacterium RBG_16_40_8]